MGICKSSDDFRSNPNTIPASGRANVEEFGLEAPVKMQRLE